MSICCGMKVVYSCCLFYLTPFTVFLFIISGQCGRRPSGSRVVNGQNSSPHSWPWQSSLRMNGGHVCGASLIRPDWVLTAAHCVFHFPKPELYTVVVGTSTWKEHWREKVIYSTIRAFKFWKRATKNYLRLQWTQTRNTGLETKPRSDFGREQAKANTIAFVLLQEQTKQK